MRSFCITISIFIISLVCIILNYSLVHTIHDEMLEYTIKLSDIPCEDNQAIIIKMRNYWKSKNALISLSVNFKDINEISNAIDSVSASNKAGDEAELNINIKKLQNAIKILIRLEKISIDNILKNNSL